MPARGLVLALLACVAACVVGASPPRAQAATPAWEPPPLPAGAADPWDAFTKPTGASGSYSASDTGRILQERFFRTPHDISARAGLNQQQTNYMIARYYQTQTLLRARTPLYLLMQSVRFVGVTGAVLTAGLIAYEVKKKWFDSEGAEQTTTEYVVFNREQLGGATVTLPPDEFVNGYDYRPASPLTNPGSPDAEETFGWQYRTGLNTDVVPSGNAWVFQYLMYYGVGSTASGCVSTCYPYYIPNVEQRVARSAFGAAANVNSCVGTLVTTCYGNQVPPNTVIRTMLGFAAQDTQVRLKGTLSPLPVRLDENVYASGHLLDDSPFGCTGSASVTQCRLAYVPQDVFERAAPRTITRTAPDGADLTPAPSTETLPADAGNDADRAALPNEPCFRAMFNSWIDPGGYPYNGCDDPPGDANDPGTGEPIDPPSEEPSPSPATTFALPEPLPQETFAEYRARLRALGYLGTVTRLNSTLSQDPAFDLELGYNPNLGPDVVVTTAPLPGTVVTTADGVSAPSTVTVYANPTTGLDGAPVPVPAPPGGSCDGYLEADPDFSPLLGIDYGGSFPFGVFTYIADVIGLFNVPADAPSFSFDLNNVGTPVGEFDLGTYGPVDLDVLDPYMSVVRDVLSVAIWVGAVWFFGTSLLGLRNAGDPGAAVDEVI